MRAHDQTRTAGALPVVALMGPTAAGKTGLAITLAQTFALDIISVDSALVYRGMDIGTAKPDPAELARAPHRLIDICDPAEVYSAGRFRRDALQAIRDSHERGRVPLLAGGTMLYFRALLDGIDELPAGDPALRARLEARAAEAGWPALHAELAAVDPAAGARIHRNDAQRIQRALEVIAATGAPLSASQTGTRKAPPWPTLRIGLIPARREVLHARIEARFRAMLEAGFVAEVRALRGRGDLTAAHSAMRAVGYRQIWQFLAGETDYDEAVRNAVTATRRLAKRQLTWLRSEIQIEVIDPTGPDGPGRAIQMVRDFLTKNGALVC